MHWVLAAVPPFGGGLPEAEAWAAHHVGVIPDCAFLIACAHDSPLAGASLAGRPTQVLRMPESVKYTKPAVRRTPNEQQIKEEHGWEALMRIKLLKRAIQVAKPEDVVSFIGFNWRVSREDWAIGKRAIDQNRQRCICLPARTEPIAVGVDDKGGITTRNMSAIAIIDAGTVWRRMGLADKKLVSVIAGNLDCCMAVLAVFCVAPMKIGRIQNKLLWQDGSRARGCDIVGVSAGWFYEAYTLKIPIRCISACETRCVSSEP